MKWSVRRREKTPHWAIYGRGCCHDAYDSHAEAMLWARRYAIADWVLNRPLEGGAV